MFSQESLRQKIAGIVAEGRGEPDKYAPESLADMKFWCVTKESRKKQASQSISAEMEAAVDPSQITDFMRILDGGSSSSGLARSSTAGSLDSLAYLQSVFDGAAGGSGAGSSGGGLEFVLYPQLLACVLLVITSPTCR